MLTRVTRRVLLVQPNHSIFQRTWVHPGFEWDSCCSIFNFCV